VVTGWDFYDQFVAQTPEGSIRTARFEAFSDGVFAIAITLLVLDIALPPGSERDLLAAVVGEWPAYVAYVISFATIGAVWLIHARVSEYLVRVNSVLLRLNLLLLLFVSFLPFPTRMLAEYVRHTDAERVAATFYGLNLIAISAVLTALWRYAMSAQLVTPELEPARQRALRNRLTPSLGGYAVGIGVALFFPQAAVALYLLIAAYLLIPMRPLRNA
jgi:uncharacterized membrane protein